MNLPAFVRERVALAPMTTLELGGAARFFVDAEDEQTLIDALAWAKGEGLAVSILGGGSNTVVTDEGVAGVVIRVRTRGETVHPVEGSRVRVTVAAGEVWDDFVGRCARRGWGGIECLSGIPGSVGATPIQNVGAYGQEVSETIVAVRVLDRDRLRPRVLSNADCRFDYRTSVFKSRRDPLSRSVVLDVTFELTVRGIARVRYADLQIALANDGVGEATIEDLRRAVISVRREKSMVISPDDPNRRSAGSFFTNPIVSAAAASLVNERALARRLVPAGTTPPQWPADRGRVKLSAAWLIERSGFAKGTTRGPVGISSKHSLALVHHGGGTTTALLALADEVIAAVRAEWDVTLEREPVILR
jgi:UDP-N-acetylmuramate dehydrogenase